jgi:hypothetical protein
MMKITWSVSMVVVSILATACSHFQTKEAAYLDSVKGRGTEAEVRKELGVPKAVRQVEGGQTVWVYELMDQQAGNRFTAPGVWCEQYLLTFDDKAVFQRWRQLSHFHAGELMPTECIPGSEQATSS